MDRQHAYLTGCPIFEFDPQFRHREVTLARTGRAVRIRTAGQLESEFAVETAGQWGITALRANVRARQVHAIDAGKRIREQRLIEVDNVNLLRLESDIDDHDEFITEVDHPFAAAGQAGMNPDRRIPVNLGNERIRVCHDRRCQQAEENPEAAKPLRARSAQLRRRRRQLARRTSPG